MAAPNRKISIRHTANAGGFDAASLNDKSAIDARHKANRFRMLASGTALLLGGLMFYVAIFYIPAFVQPRKVLKLATGESAALQTESFDKNSRVHKNGGFFSKLFHIDRAYMKAGQSIEIEYNLPVGSYANLNITQCQRAWVLEIFRCKVVGQFNSRTKRQIGAEKFSLEDSGFYYFKHELVDLPAGEPYRIIWERGDE